MGGKTCFCNSVECCRHIHTLLQVYHVQTHLCAQLIAQVIAQAQECWLGNGLVLIDRKLIPEADVPAYCARSVARLTSYKNADEGLSVRTLLD